MRVLLIQPPLEDFYTTPIRLYPLGLLYVARVFQEAGATVQILDCLSPLKKRQLPLPADFFYLRPFLEENPFLFKHYYRFGLSEKKIVSAIKAFAPDLIGIASQFTAYYHSVEELSVLIKKKFKTPVFIGGNHATVFKEKIRERTPEIDDILTGPAEKAAAGFLSLQGGRSLSSHTTNWKIRPPAHELLNGDRYRIGRKNYISLTASRGCPYNCDFCSVQAMFGRRMDYRKVEDVLGEMHWNYKQKNVRIFNFEDDNLSFDKIWFTRFLKAVIKDPILKGIELTAMNGICYPTLDAALLALMYQAGFRRINLAFVTRDIGLQQSYHRPRHHPDFDNIIETARRLGFFVTVYVIIGLPGQTYKEVKESIDYLLGLGVLVGPSVFYIPPGSALFDRLDVPPEILSNWNLYRSSAFALETDLLSRADLVELFAYARRRNLENREDAAVVKKRKSVAEHQKT